MYVFYSSILRWSFQKQMKIRKFTAFALFDNTGGYTSMEVPDMILFVKAEDKHLQHRLLPQAWFSYITMHLRSSLVQFPDDWG